MGALKWAMAWGMAALSQPVDARTIDRWRPYVAEASARFAVPVSWIERVMQAESQGRTQVAGRPIRSPVGAMGLMQLMPRTWAEMRARLGLGHDPDDPRDNILAGTFYLRLMHDRFGYPGLFAAYNAGPGRYGRYLAGRSDLPRETIGYLASVASSVSSPVSPAPSMTIFAVRKSEAMARPEAVSREPSSPLFIVLSQGD